MSTILIIEDQAIFQRIYQEVFERKDLEVLSATDGQAGLKLALERKPDLILLDLLLPKLNGLEFLEAFDPKSHPNTKIIVFSNVDLEDQQQAALRLGAVKYLVKSEYFTPNQLIATIDDFL